MHQAAYAALGLNLRYVAIDVPSGEVHEALDHLRTIGYRGVNVTVPHKEEALTWATDVESFAERVRAANTFDLPKRACINTDAPGFMQTIQPTSGRALVLGAGGTARALCLALCDAGWQIRLYNRTREKAFAMFQDLGLTGSVVDVPVARGCDLIVNTTSASLQGEPLAIDWGGTNANALAYDLMYSHEPIPFLVDSAQHGLQTKDGRALLVAQGGLAFQWWTGHAPPYEAMTRAID
jgi:shikimate dehydrogenase